jgi:hypothetical protein
MAIANTVELSPSLAKKAVTAYLSANLPVMLWSAPGAAKSSIVREIAKEMGVELRDIRLATLDPVDLRGLPVPDLKARVTSWLAAGFLPTDKKSKGIIFFDEINKASQATAGAAYQLILDRAIGEYELPPGWKIIAAGNRDTDKAYVERMPSALISRFVHVDLIPSKDDFADWAMANGIRQEILSYLNYRPGNLHNMKDAAREFPCPRTWEYLSRALEAKPAAEIEHAVISGCVGSGVAAEFAGFLRIYRQLPNIAEIIAKPEKHAVPDDPQVLYALSGALAHNMTPKNAEKLDRFIARMPGEFQVLAWQDATRRDRALQNVSAFGDFAVRNQTLLS